MDNDIKVGDLVMVVRDCCGHWLGMIFKVGGIQPGTNLSCDYCRLSVPMPFAINAHWARPSIYNAPLPWLRKIPPLSREDSIETTKSEQMDNKVYETR